jgi:putative SbcD/Mre11-related phosphoesterase
MRFLTGEAAAVIGRTLLAADLHLGIELAFRERGVFVPLQEKRVARKIAGLARTHSCTEVCVVGDCKHDVFGFENQEKKMMKDFLTELRKANPEIISFKVVKGNHDSQLDELSREDAAFEVIPPQGFVLEDEGVTFGVFHGHAWPSPSVLSAKRLLCAHLHPLLEFSDKAGAWRIPCWLIGKTKANKKMGVKKRECVVFPAFGALSGGTVVNREKGIGVLFENGLFDLKNAKAFSLDGLNLGKVNKKH